MSKIDQWRRRLARQASRMVLGGFRPPAEPSVCWFGKVLLGAKGEEWPRQDGKPMWALCQINCGELPFRPDGLADVEFITVFIAAEEGEWPDGTANGDRWCLRAYGPGVPLLPLQRPEGRSPIKAMPVRWELVKRDFPTHDDLPEDFPDELREEYEESGFENQSGSKVGGWPTNVQSEIFWAPHNRHPADPQYVFQIDSEPKANWSWGDRGVGYFGRGTGESGGVWTMSWQCY